MAESARVKVVVSGRVQGVFFRDTCRRLAGQLGLAGSVSNRATGDVEAVFEGDPTAVQRMVDWCRHGPRGAVVTDVRVTDETPTGERGFTVR